MALVFIVIGLGLEAALAAAVARRVLGVPVGWPRSVVVGLLTIFSLGGDGKSSAQHHRPQRFKRVHGSPHKGSSLSV